MHEIDVTIPLHLTADRVYPMEGRSVINPNELLEQVLVIGDVAARKVFYIILSQNHRTAPDDLEYTIPFSDIYSARIKDVGNRGRALADRIRRHFQNTSFRVHAKFVTTYLKRSAASNPYISPFSLVDFIKGEWKIRLTAEFKTYLTVFQKMLEREFHYTKGDVELLKNFKSIHSDRIYWMIRREQWVRGTKTVAVDELKAFLGNPTMVTSELFRVCLDPVREEMKGTWAEFGYDKIHKGRGNKVQAVKFLFERDATIRMRLEADVKFGFEVSLRSHGVDIDYIHLVRHRIIRGDVISGKLKWCWHYVWIVIQETDRLNAAGNVKNVPAYIVEALSRGYYIDKTVAKLGPEILDNLDSLGTRLGKQIKPGIAVKVKASPYNLGDPVPEGMEVYENRMDWKRYLVPEGTMEKAIFKYGSMFGEKKNFNEATPSEKEKAP